MDIHWHGELGSTSDEAWRLAGTGAPHGTVVAARQQTAGRGRQGRRWISPPGNLYASFLFRTGALHGFAPACSAQPGFLAALAVAEAIDPHVPGSRLKWPNDVLLSGAKVCGILTELAGDALVIGIGVNIGQAPPDLPYPATSLSRHGAAVTPEALLDGIAARLGHWLADWDVHGFAPVRTAWMARGPAAGQALTVRDNGSAAQGGYGGLDGDGALLLHTPEGLRRMVAGETG